MLHMQGAVQTNRRQPRTTPAPVDPVAATAPQVTPAPAPASPSQPLAHTGSDGVVIGSVVAGALLLAGATLMVVRRRRSSDLSE